METLNFITHAELKQWAEDLGFQSLGVSDIDLSSEESYLHKWLNKKFMVIWNGCNATVINAPAQQS